MNQQALATLKTCRDSLNESLLHIAEYRALVSIDKTILEISQIAASAPAHEQRDEAPALVPREDDATAVATQAAPDNPVAPRAPNRLALAIAESIEANVSTLKPQRPTNPGLHHLFRTVS